MKNPEDFAHDFTPLKFYLSQNSGPADLVGKTFEIPLPEAVRLESALAQVQALKAQLAVERSSADALAERTFEGLIARERDVLQEQKAFLVASGMKQEELKALMSSCREQARQRLMQAALQRIDELLGA